MDAYMKEPLISILIPCYNNQVFIYALLRSIFEQTYHNIEILIRDDMSASFSVEKLIEWVRYYKPKDFGRVVISRNDENLGMVANMERLQQDSKGKYLFHIAADDVLYDCTVMQRFVEELERLSELGQEPEAIIAQVEMWDHDIKVKQSDFIPEEIINLIKVQDYAGIFALCASKPLLPAQYLYHRSVKEKIGKLSDLYCLIEDWPSILRMTRMGIRLSYMDGLPSVKRRHGGISHVNALQSKRTFIRYYKELIEVYYNEVEPYEDILSLEDRETARQYAIDRTNELLLCHIPALRKQEKESLVPVAQTPEMVLDPA